MTSKNVIVIVDDDADDREIIRDAFAAGQDGADYIFLESGDALMDHLQEGGAKNHPSLIMLDLNMPGKDGREALREMKSDPLFSTIPVVVFTTSSSARDRQAIYTLGANCFVTKPDTFAKLVELTKSISLLWLPQN
jgi:CheY-like chemotaxis protein